MKFIKNGFKRALLRKRIDRKREHTIAYMTHFPEYRKIQGMLGILQPVAVAGIQPGPVFCRYSPFQYWLM